MDWSQARAALDRQRRALDSFKNNEIPNKNIRDYIVLKYLGDTDKKYSKVSSYFDSNLDDDKKSIVSFFLATEDLILIHGPPGTGKTRLIVELIKQHLSRNLNAKVLLVSQTHVAIDNALEPLVKDTTDISVVRIGSGSKDISTNVKHCSIEECGRVLLSDIEINVSNYLREKAAEFSVDINEITTGLKAIEYLSIKHELEDKLKVVNGNKDEIELLKSELSEILKSTFTNKEESKIRTKIKTLDDEISMLEPECDFLSRRLKIVKEQLIKNSEDGKELVQLDDYELQEWCDELTNQGNNKKLRNLMEMSEDWKLQIAKSDDLKVAIIANANVVAGTCIGFCREKAALSCEFDLCIIDEASKATTTELLVPMAQAKKVVLVGDHHQLPAVIDHALTRKEVQDDYSLSKDSLEKQLFEILQNNLGEGNKDNLVIQHRMLPPIGNLISSCFYDNKLKNAESLNERKVVNLEFAGLNKSVVWFDTDHDKRWIACERKSGTSFINSVEADCMISILKRLLLVFDKSTKNEFKDYSIGIISGYSAQTTYVRREINKEPLFDKLNISCDTVHAFQGRQVDICIYSITRNNRAGDIGFLQDWRHLNVALSRAKDYLVIVGGYHFCHIANEPNPFSDLAHYITENESCDVKEWNYE